MKLTRSLFPISHLWGPSQEVTQLLAKKAEGWERYGGNVEIVRHEDTHRSFWRIPLLGEAVVIPGGSLSWALDLESEDLNFKRRLSFQTRLPATLSI